MIVPTAAAPFLSLIFLIEAGAILALASLAWCDWSNRRLPNILIALLLGLAIARAAASGCSLPWLAASMLLILGIALLACGIWGGGDAKLLAVCGLWTPDRIGMFLYSLALFGGVLSLAYGVRHLYRRRTQNTRTTMHADVPFGIAIALAAATQIVKPYLHHDLRFVSIQQIPFFSL